jgi:plastocyanin
MNQRHPSSEPARTRAWLSLLPWLLVGAARATDPAGPTATIEIRDFAYTPGTLTIAVGTTVVWRNRDSEPHTVRGADESVRSGALDQDESYSVRFDRPGTYRYGCSIHPQMAGTIVVR